MLRKYLISISSVIIFLLTNEMVYANQKNTSPTIEEKFTEVGYT